MEKSVFNELMNKGIVTNVGLNHENYTDIEDLQNKGFATSIGAKEIYNEVISDNSTPEVTETPTEEPTNEEQVTE